jgi:hypothetical protein
LLHPDLVLDVPGDAGALIAKLHEEQTAQRPALISRSEAAALPDLTAREAEPAPMVAFPSMTASCELPGLGAGVSADAMDRASASEADVYVVSPAPSQAPSRSVWGRLGLGREHPVTRALSGLGIGLLLCGMLVGAYPRRERDDERAPSDAPAARVDVRPPPSTIPALAPGLKSERPHKPTPSARRVRGRAMSRKAAPVVAPASPSTAPSSSRAPAPWVPIQDSPLLAPGARRGDSPLLRRR